MFFRSHCMSSLFYCETRFFFTFTPSLFAPVNWYINRCVFITVAKCGLHCQSRLLHYLRPPSLILLTLAKTNTICTCSSFHALHLAALRLLFCCCTLPPLLPLPRRMQQVCSLVSDCSLHLANFKCDVSVYTVNILCGAVCNNMGVCVYAHAHMFLVLHVLHFDRC